jgi:ribosome-associated toxin RatA of RatAB toxin-antitoxin module
MSRYAASDQVLVAATPQACFDALTDYERLPEWQGSLKRTVVVERRDGGAVVEYVLDARVREVTYRLSLEYDAPGRISTTYVSGDFRDLSAEWRFDESEGGVTRVQLELHLDAGWRVPGPIRSVVQDLVLSRAMRDLKSHVEAADHPR